MRFSQTIVGPVALAAVLQASTARAECPNNSRTYNSDTGESCFTWCECGDAPESCGCCSTKCSGATESAPEGSSTPSATSPRLAPAGPLPGVVRLYAGPGAQSISESDLEGDGALVFGAQIARGARVGRPLYPMLEVFGIKQSYEPDEDTFDVGVVLGIEWAPAASFVISPFLQAGLGLVMMATPDEEEPKWFGAKLAAGLEVGLGAPATRSLGSRFSLFIAATAIGNGGNCAVGAVNAGLAIR